MHLYCLLSITESIPRASQAALPWSGRRQADIDHCRWFADSGQLSFAILHRPIQHCLECIIIIIIIQRQCFSCCPHDHGHCESSPGSFDECRLSAGWPPTLRPSQPSVKVGHEINIYQTKLITLATVAFSSYIMSYLSKVANFNLPHLHLSFPLWVTPFEFCRDLWHQKNRVTGPSCGFAVCVILHLAVSAEHQLVTDRQYTERLRHIPSMASRGKNHCDVVVRRRWTSFFFHSVEEPS